MHKVKVVVIGVGSIGERHVRCFLATGRTEVACVEINPTLAATIAGRYGIPAFPDMDTALTAFQPQVAVVATPAPLHIPQSLQLARAGLHLLIEKPLSTSLNQVDELRQVIAERNRTVAVAYVLRAFPELVSLRAALQSGRFGAPRQIISVGGQHFPTYRPAYRQIYYNDRRMGGGAIQDALTHMINLGEWLVGPVDRVVGDAAHQVLPDVEVEDTVHVLTRQGDVLGCYSLNQHQAPNETSVTIVCDGGTVRCDIHLHRWLWMTAPGGTWQEEAFGPAERDTAFIVQANAFLDAIAGTTPPLCSLDEGWQTLRVNLAILESLTTGQWQDISRSN